MSHLVCSDGYDADALVAYLCDDDPDKRLAEHLQLGQCQACAEQLRDLRLIHDAFDASLPSIVTPVWTRPPSWPESLIAFVRALPRARPNPLAVATLGVVCVAVVITYVWLQRPLEPHQTVQRVTAPERTAAMTAEPRPELRSGRGRAVGDGRAAMSEAAAGGGAGRRGMAVSRAAWREVETGWREVGGGDRAGLLSAEDDNAGIVRLMRVIQGLWREGAEVDRGALAAFWRELEEVLRGRGTGSGIEEYCGAEQWQFAGGSIIAREEERRKLEARRERLEDERRELEVERREWEVRRRELEVRRRELEAIRRAAEADRAALEAEGGADSEDYWQGIRNYERVLFEDYASVFNDEMRTFWNDYNNFMSDTYVAGQQEHVDGMAELLVGYGAVRWGCEAVGERQLF